MLDWLRNHIKTDLPIELFSYADELKDEGDRASLQAFNVTLRKVREFLDSPHCCKVMTDAYCGLQIDQGHHFWERDYSIKSKAFIQSSFQKFMYLDSVRRLALESIRIFALTLPSVLIRTPSLCNFWTPTSIRTRCRRTDRPGTTTSTRTTARTPSGEFSGRHAQASIGPSRVVRVPFALEPRLQADTVASWSTIGQVLFDKAGNEGLNLAVLHLADKMLMDGDHFKDLSFGDKDTFRYGFYALDLPWSPAPRVYSPVGGYQDRDGVPTEDFHGHTLLNVRLCIQPLPTWDAR